jgi:RNA recognition motif-containing protein
MDEIETLLNNLGEEQMKDILADAARTHPDILDAIKEAAKDGEGGHSNIPPIPSRDQQEPPHKVICLNNLPDSASEIMLMMLFQQFPGFREVRLDHAKKGVAYVEYHTEAEATVAMASLQHFKITPETPILITYAKKV